MRRNYANGRKTAKLIARLGDLVCYLLFLSHLLALTMTWHPTMEFPAHLAVSFFDGQLSATLIKVLQLDLVLLLCLLCIRFFLWCDLVE